MGTRHKCIICGTHASKDGKGRSIVEKHHICYKPEAVIPLCRVCHHIITRYERGSSEDWDSNAEKVIEAYSKIKPGSYIITGSEVLSIRVTSDLGARIRKRAWSKGQTMSEYLTACIQYIEKHIPNEKKEV